MPSSSVSINRSNALEQGVDTREPVQLRLLRAQVRRPDLSVTEKAASARLPLTKLELTQINSERDPTSDANETRRSERGTLTRIRRRTAETPPRTSKRQRQCAVGNQDTRWERPRYAPGKPRTQYKHNRIPGLGNEGCLETPYSSTRSHFLQYSSCQKCDCVCLMWDCV
eukprot:716285-Rhodomonas_salina.3